MTLLVVCPSYRRQKEAGGLLASFVETAGAGTELLFSIEQSDSERYAGLPVTISPDGLTMVQRTNRAAQTNTHDYIGWVADDMRFLTPGWDEMVSAELERVPIVYGNDCVDPGSKPAHVFVRAEVVKALGWLHPPQLLGTFGDDTWKYLGELIGISYLPQVKISNPDPPRDNERVFLHDLEVFQRWVAEEAETDANKCLAALRRQKRSRQSCSTSTARSSTATAGTLTLSR